MSIILRHKFRNLAILALVLLSGLPACAPKGPEFAGRFLFLDNLGICEGGNQLSVFEYKAGMESPTLLWTGIPCEPKWGLSSIPLSQDGRYAMLISDHAPNRLVLLNLTTGESKSLPLPDFDISKAIKIIGAFSPNNRYFAFSEYNPSDYLILPRVYLMDLATGTNSILFENPCARYGPLGDNLGSTVCASIGLPQWIDDTTLVFSGYSGDMPNAVKRGINIDPNRTFVMDVDGKILQEFMPALFIGRVFGPTLLYYEYGKSEEGYKWMDTADLKHGEIKPHLLDVASQFRAGKVGDKGYLELPDISPDGQFAFQRIDGVWHLIGLRSSSDTKIRNTSEQCGMWSPDQKYILCGDAKLGIISLEGSVDRELVFPQLYWLFAWLP